MNMKMQMIQNVSIVNLIQMKWMKVIYKNKNMTNKEFQHFVESKLIEVMNMKMQMIQFGSIINFIQIKLTKVIYILKSIRTKNFNTAGNQN
jgi:hypothetical protein